MAEHRRSWGKEGILFPSAGKKAGFTGLRLDLVRLHSPESFNAIGRRSQEMDEKEGAGMGESIRALGRFIEQYLLKKKGR